MSEVHKGRLDALEQIWRSWCEFGAQLTEDQWSTPTRCTGWDVAALYAHHSAFPLALSGPLPTEDVPGKPVAADEIIRGFNASASPAAASPQNVLADSVADQAIADAAAHSRVELVDRFRVHAPNALSRLRQISPTLVIPWPPSESVTTVVEALRIVLMEATVHLLDGQRALSRPPAVPPLALRETTFLLTEVAPPIPFIEAATGRSTHSPLPVVR